jgi:hypothetical protein
MNYYQKMLPVCNRISEMLNDCSVPKATLDQALTHLSEERPIQALELVSKRKLQARFAFERSALTEVENILVSAIISHAQKMEDLRQVVKIASVSPENNTILWARAAGLKYQPPIPDRGRNKYDG